MKFALLIIGAIYVLGLVPSWIFHLTLTPPGNYTRWGCVTAVLTWPVWLPRLLLS